MHGHQMAPMHQAELRSLSAICVPILQMQGSSTPPTTPPSLKELLQLQLKPIWDKSEGSLKGMCAKFKMGEETRSFCQSRFSNIPHQTLCGAVCWLWEIWKRTLHEVAANPTLSRFTQFQGLTSLGWGSRWKSTPPGCEDKWLRLDFRVWKLPLG